VGRRGRFVGRPGGVAARCDGDLAGSAAASGPVRSTVPARLDWLPWSSFQWRVIVALGVTWVLDGIEITVAGSIADRLRDARTLHLSSAQVGLAAVNSTYRLDAMIGAAANLAFLNQRLFGINIGWRLALLIGPVVGAIIWPLRRHIPESPRWLLTHGRPDEAERIARTIEQELETRGTRLEPVSDDRAIEIRQRVELTYRDLARLLLGEYRRRSVVGFILMTTQSFLYNAIFFTYALILAQFYGIRGGTVAYFIFPFALGNLLGPLLLGRFFDTLGRRIMVGGTYTVSGVLLLLTGWLFNAGVLNAVTQTLLWCVIFFFASSAASSAYLTVSEVFPVELRAQAISFFFAMATLCGGVVAPWLFATLIGDGHDRGRIFAGYAIAGVLMIVGGLTEFAWGVNAEQRSLEEVATPLSARASAASAAVASGLDGGLKAHVRRHP
jgi:MFS family permease